MKTKTERYFCTSYSRDLPLYSLIAHQQAEAAPIEKDRLANLCSQARQEKWIST